MGPRRRREVVLAPLLLASLASAGCVETRSVETEGRSDPGTAAGPGVQVVDHRGDTIGLDAPATRVLSLVPSVTQTLDRMGAADLLVGRTDYDTLSAVADLPTVGGGLGPNLEILRTLEPQVVITFAGESDPRTSRGLAALEIPEVAVRPDRLADVPAIVGMMGLLTGRQPEADSLVRSMDAELNGVRAAVVDLPPVRAVYLLGGSPPLAASAGTFISDLMELAGGRNVLHDLEGLYAPVSPEVLRAREIDVLLVGEGSSLDPRITRDRRVATIPSWVEIPGPDLGRAAWIVARALHPSLSGNVP